MTCYTLVTGDFVRTGGMDAANYHLAAHLARSGASVHLVAHRVDAELLRLPTVVWHRVRKPLDSYRLGAPLLSRDGRRWGREGARVGGRIVVNGGNCPTVDTNWVHYVHAAYGPEHAHGNLARVVQFGAHRRAERAERIALRLAGRVIVNSRRTAADVQHRVGVEGGRIRCVYYGTDPDRHRPPAPDERTAMRAALGWADDRPAIAFVGALGDRRKGFDVVFNAWETLARDSGWDARLVVVGSGRELPAWRARAHRTGLTDQMQFTGFIPDVRRVLWACDAMVAPARYEAYGLAVHEAVCCGLPVMVSANAGVSERLEGLEQLRLQTPIDAADLVTVLRQWRNEPDEWRRRTVAVGERLRAWTWGDMAAQIVDAMAEGS